MHKRYLWVAAVTVFAVIASVLIVAFLWPWQANKSTQPHPNWIAPAQGEIKLQGKQLYAMYCASCHGAELEGQSNWRARMANGRLPAPPHDINGHTWHHPDWQLVEMTKIGFVGGVNAPPGYESDMPAFKDVLTDEQIRFILAYIKTSWPESALAAQKEITLKNAP
ncbi:MAG TPA: cytochrome c [Orrella sp.]